MATLRTLLNRLLRDQRGFSIIETTTSGLLIIVGVLGTFMALDAGARTTHDAQRTEQAAAVAQREVERLKALPYQELGMATMPTPSTGDVRDPNRWVEGTKLVLAERYRDAASPRIGAGAEELVNGGTVTPGPEAFDSGGTRGTIHRYVTWRDDACAPAGCTGAQDQKRITVAVVLKEGAGGFAPKPTWVSTVVVDPEAVPPGEQVAPSASVGSGTPVTAQGFYLYDTPCSKLERQAPDAHHPTHATATDTCTGDQVPDLMGPDAPPGATTDGAILPRYNFSSDVTRTAAVADGAAGPYGAALRRHSDSDCFASSNDPTVLHRWATPAFKALFATPETGRARTGFSLVSRTLSGVSGAVTACVRLHAMSNPAKTLAAGTYALAQWPTEPESVSFVLNHDGFEIAKDDRLVLTLSLKSTSQQDIELRYDHPDDRTFISVATTTPLS